jgi:hypothetical protein
VHKAQGLTLKPTVYDSKGQFVSGQGYTALSRAPGWDALHLLSLAPRESFKLDPSIEALLKWMDYVDVIGVHYHPALRNGPMPTVDHRQKFKGHPKMPKKPKKNKKGAKKDVAVPEPVRIVDPEYNDFPRVLKVLTEAETKELADVTRILNQIHQIPVVQVSSSPSQGTVEREDLTYLQAVGKVIAFESG